ncbi:hypothetical protein GCM10007870_29650 [Gluconobacter kondonii]|uniref:RNA polymerase sigma-70 region 4 domain-containing protein n=1 Tax=Gluconobacter kondonii TaxID=941463 RepID=A0ABQ5WUZ9_9PROT|nr:hypothetical protein AA3266_2446 [Gluconobacter kondonii NBRC 3266]GLQ67380.1 hypothetical protein GCM10007870_29650 [Gluconobacter kondonii]
MKDTDNEMTTEMISDVTRERAIYDNSPRAYRNARIEEMRRKGATYKELAEKFSISISRVRQVVAVQERRRLHMLNQVDAPLRHAT